MDILDLFWGPLTASCPKSHDISAFSPKRPSQDLLKTLLFWPNFASFWTLFEGPVGRLWLGPVQAAFGLEGPVWGLSNPCPDLKFWYFDHFSHWKVNFCHFAYQGSVKMPFWPYFDPILSPPTPNFFWPWPKCAYLFPLPEGPWRDPQGPQIWPYF